MSVTTSFRSSSRTRNGTAHVSDHRRGSGLCERVMLAARIAIIENHHETHFGLTPAAGQYLAGAGVRKCSSF